MSERKRLLFIHASKDEDFRQALENHLTKLKDDGFIESWHVGLLPPGEKVDQVLAHEVAKAQVVLLLLSSDSIASSMCQELLAKVEADGTAIVVPILIRPVVWQTSGRENRQALPRNGLAVTEWDNQDAAWVAVVNELRALLTEEVVTSPPSAPAPLVAASQGSSSLPLSGRPGQKRQWQWRLGAGCLAILLAFVRSEVHPAASAASAASAAPTLKLRLGPCVDVYKDSMRRAQAKKAEDIYIEINRNYDFNKDGVPDYVSFSRLDRTTAGGVLRLYAGFGHCGIYLGTLYGMEITIGDYVNNGFYELEVWQRLGWEYRKEVQYSFNGEEYVPTLWRDCHCIKEKDRREINIVTACSSNDTIKDCGSWSTVTDDADILR